MDIVKSLGERIIELRKQKGITREDLAKEFDIPYTTLRNYENGLREPGHLFLIKVAEKFNVTTDYLLGISSETQQNSAPAEQLGESEELLHNYKLLNSQGKKRLIEYSHDLTEHPMYASPNSEEKKPIMVPIRSVARNGLILENEIPEDVANEISEKLKTPHSNFKW